SRILLVQFRAWRLQVGKEKELGSARAELGIRETQLAREYQSLDKETKEDREKETAGQESASPSPAASASHDISSLKEAAGERKHLAELHKRTTDLQQLDTIYGQWAALIKDRELQHRSSLLEGCGWILALLLLVLFADPMVRGVVARAAPESRRRHT